MRKTFFRIASLLAMLGVVLGAFASHSLKGKLSPEQLDTFQTGVRYHFYHALALLVVAIFLYFRKTKLLILSAWLFTAGIVFFSGSLYLLAMRDWLNFEAPWLGPVTPLGGLLFIAGWAMLFLSSFQENALRNGNGNGNGHKA